MSNTRQARSHSQVRNDIRLKEIGDQKPGVGIAIQLDLFQGDFDSDSRGNVQPR